MNARRITTALTAPAIAVGIFFGGLSVSAPAQAKTSPASPAASTAECSTMAMPAVRANADNLNPLTRAAQVSQSQAGLQGPPVRNAC